MPETSVGMVDEPQIVEQKTIGIGVNSSAEPSLQVQDALLRVRSLAAVLARQAAREEDDVEVPADGASKTCTATSGAVLVPVSLDDLVVRDNFPRRIPIATREIDVIEMYFASLLDEVFGTKTSGLTSRRAKSLPS